MGLAGLPDLIHRLLIVAWWLAGDGTPAPLRAYAIAVPSQEPTLPPMVALLSYHSHCDMHGAISWC